MKLFSTVALVSVAFISSAALAENIATPGNPDGWTAQNVTPSGSVAITGTYAPPGETGSLQFTSADASGKADFVHSLTGTLGDLVHNQNSALNYDYFVSSSSSANDNLAPAFRLGFYDAASNKYGYLIYEPVYNGSPSSVPQDTWVHNDIKNANFWMREFGPGHTVEQYNVTLAQWASGTHFSDSFTLSDNTQIYGVEVGVGSGWSGTFDGAADHVNVNFDRAGTSGVSTNFELAAAAVPEPATWAMMLGGFGLIGGAMRRRSRDSAQSVTA